MKKNYVFPVTEIVGFKSSNPVMEWTEAGQEFGGDLGGTHVASSPTTVIE